MKTHVCFRRAAVLGLLLGLVWPASAGLIHRYSFTTDARDSVGTANGVIRQLNPSGTPLGAPITFDGKANLDGVGGYIDLPNGLVSGLTNITVEAWVEWTGAGNWPRIFDFGTNDKGEDTDGTKSPSNGVNYLFLCTQANTGGARFAITDGTGERPVLNDLATFPIGEVYVAVTYGPAGANLYVNGILITSGNSDIPLSKIQDVNNWLGRSNWPDPLYAGSINDFRIHDVMLTSQEIAASLASGPDAVNYVPGTISDLTLTVPASLWVGETRSVQLQGTFSGVGNIKLAGSDATLSSSNPDVISVSSAGIISAKEGGSATITATLGGKTATANISVASLLAELKNRYSFSEPAGSTTVVDSVGGQNGTLFPGTNASTVITLGNGQANFPTNVPWQDAAYIALPAGLVSSRTDITFEMWYTFRGPVGTGWQRVFEFGSSTKTDPHADGSGANQPGMFFTPNMGGANTFRFVGKGSSGAENPVLDTAATALNTQVHVVCVYSPSLGYSRVYVNGAPRVSGLTPFALSGVADPYCWLGVSAWNDAPFNGSINEFRIYEGALGDLDVTLHYNAGPTNIPATAGSIKSLALQPTTLFIANPTAAIPVLLGTFQTVTNLDIGALSGVTYQVLASNDVFTITTAGRLLPVNAGTADLIATYSGMSSTSKVTVIMPTALTIVTTTLNADGVRTNLPLIAEFPGTNLNVRGFTGVGLTLTSSVPTVALVSTGGVMTPFVPGTTEISAAYGGLTAKGTITTVLPANYMQAKILHRYSFNEQPGDTNVTDSVGGANGDLILGNGGSDFDGTGGLLLTNNGYVNLPNGLVSSLTNSGCTIEGWLTWGGPASSSWQRIFDFGRNGAVDANGQFVEDGIGNPGIGCMFLCPKTGGTVVRFSIKQGTGAEQMLDRSGTMDVGTNVHFAVVYDWPARSVRLYYNGVLVNVGTAGLNLNVVEDRNVWLGRSQYTDPYLNGTLSEFRIYEGVLFGNEIESSFAAGPDAVITPATPAPTLAAARVDNTLVLTWPASATGFTLQTVGVLGAPWTPANVTPTQDAANMKVTIPIGSSNAFFQLRK